MFGGRFITIAISFLTSIYIMTAIVRAIWVFGHSKKLYQFFMYFCFQGFHSVLLEGAGTDKNLLNFWRDKQSQIINSYICTGDFFNCIAIYPLWSENNISNNFIFFFNTDFSIIQSLERSFTVNENFFTITLFKIIPSIIYFVISLILLKIFIT